MTTPNIQAKGLFVIIEHKMNSEKTNSIGLITETADTEAETKGVITSVSEFLTKEHGEEYKVGDTIYFKAYDAKLTKGDKKLLAIHVSNIVGKQID